MNRRSFFKRLAVGAAVAVIAPKVLLDATQPKAGYRTYVMAQDAMPCLDLATIRRMKQELCSAEVQPFKGRFYGVIHPFHAKMLRELA